MALIDSIKNFSTTEANRSEALDLFKNKEFPTTKDEEWKFTNLKKIVSNDYQVGTNEDVSPADITSFINDGLSGSKVVFINGHWSEEYSQIKASDAIVTSLNNAAAEYPDTFANYFNKSIRNKTDSLAALNTAMHSDGVFIQIEKGKTEASPINVYFVNNSKNAASFVVTRNLIAVEENAEVNIAFHYATIGANKSLLNEATEVFIGKSGRGSLTRIQNDTTDASQISNTEIEQSSSSNFTTNTFSFSGELIRNNLNFALNGEHIESHMNGLYMIDGNTHVDNHTVADHKFPNCESHELYKGIMDDKSNGVFNGKIFVRPNAQKTNAFQSNKNLILSDSAKVNSKPQLEIWADDVSCSHGCTTGQLDQEALFYLEARGISPIKAKALLLQAFAADVVEKISQDDLKDRLLILLGDRLID